MAKIGGRNTKCLPGCPSELNRAPKTWRAESENNQGVNKKVQKGKNDTYYIYADKTVQTHRKNLPFDYH